MGLLELRSDPTAVPSTEGKYTRVGPSTRDDRPRGDEAGTLTMFSIVHLRCEMSNVRGVHKDHECDVPIRTPVDISLLSHLVEREAAKANVAGAVEAYCRYVEFVSELKHHAGKEAVIVCLMNGEALGPKKIALLWLSIEF